MEIYILSAKQISIQKPLSEEWMSAPIYHTEKYVRAIDPDFKQFLAPNIARRLGKILKRAIITSREALSASSVEMPDAIISGTGLGCIENTEIFLDAMVREGESFLQPTHFMQSTHNTISSLIAIDLKCHGYNSTYVQKGISFESALLDAFTQFSLGKISSALVGGYDEMTPSYHLLLSKAGYWGGDSFSGETSVSFMLSTSKEVKPLCSLCGISLLYKPDNKQFETALQNILEQSGTTRIEALMTGINGDSNNDSIYNRVIAKYFPNTRLYSYKNIFGESYTASGLGVYAAAHILASSTPETPRNILLYNHSDNTSHSLILLSSC